MHVDMKAAHDLLPVIHVTSNREAQAWVTKVRKEMDVRIAFQLKKRGFSNVGVAKAMGVAESTVRSLFKETELRLQNDKC